MLTFIVVIIKNARKKFVLGATAATFAAVFMLVPAINTVRYVQVRRQQEETLLSLSETGLTDAKDKKGYGKHSQDGSTPFREGEPGFGEEFGDSEDAADREDAALRDRDQHGHPHDGLWRERMDRRDEKQVSRLRKLVNNLVSLSKLDEQDTAFEAALFFLSDAAYECVDLYESVAESAGKRIEAEIEEDVNVTADENSIRSNP